MIKLYTDCKTDMEKASFFRSGGGWEFGIVAKSLGSDLADVFAFRDTVAKALAELRAEMADAAQNRDDFDAAVTSIDSGIDMLKATIVKLGLDAEVARYNQEGRK